MYIHISGTLTRIHPILSGLKIFSLLGISSLSCTTKFVLQDDAELAENVAAEAEAAQKENSEISKEHLETLNKIKQSQRKDYIDVIVVVIIYNYRCEADGIVG